MYQSLDNLETKASMMSGKPASSRGIRPDNNSLLQQAGQQRKEGVGIGSFFGSHVPGGENFTEAHGLEMMETFANFLINNMECLHQRMEALQQHLPQNAQCVPLPGRPNNELLYKQLDFNRRQGLQSASFYYDRNQTERKLIQMMLPVTHILVLNAEHLQQRLQRVVIPMLQHLR